MQNNMQSTKHIRNNKPAALNVALHTEPHKIEAGKPATLMLKLTDAMGEPFTDLMIHHDRGSPCANS